MGKIRQITYICIGIVSVILGIIGIFVPGLPTTPFLLLSSWLFYKSSARMHRALLNSKWLGKYIRHYESREGLSLVSKLISILCMWVMIGCSVCFFIENLHLRILVLILGGVGTASISLLVPTAKK